MRGRGLTAAVAYALPAASANTDGLPCRPSSPTLGLTRLVGVVVSLADHSQRPMAERDHIAWRPVWHRRRNVGGSAGAASTVSRRSRALQGKSGSPDRGASCSEGPGRDDGAALFPSSTAQVRSAWLPSTAAPVPNRGNESPRGQLVALAVRAGLLIAFQRLEQLM
jgi:hypothetical protein